MEPIHFEVGSKTLEPFTLTTAVPLTSAPLPGKPHPLRNGRCPSELNRRTPSASEKGFFSKFSDSFADTAKAIGEGLKTMRNKKGGDVDDVACRRFAKHFPKLEDELLYGDYQCNILCKNGEASGFLQITDRNLVFIAEDRDVLTIPLTSIISTLRVQIALNRIVAETGSTTNAVEVFLCSKQYLLFHEFIDNESALDCFNV